MSALKPDAVDTHDLGTTALPWKNLHIDAVTIGARAAGANVPTGSEVVIGSSDKLTADPSVPVDVEIYGSLTVHGNTTTISSSNLSVNDKNIIVASGANAAALWTGSGLTVDGANATLLYTDDGAGVTQWEFNNDLELAGSLLPVANVTHDLGSSSVGWNDLYLGDGGIIQLGNDQDVTLTHVADTGLRLNDSMKLEFRDATEFLHSDADGSMTLEGGASVKLSVASNTVLSVDANSVDIAQQLNVDAVTDSTSTTTGALVVDGGMGLAGDAHLGGDLSLQHDAAVLHLGADDDVSLTHVADTGLLLNSSRQLQFGDNATYIHQSVDGQLDAVADVELALTAPVIDLDASSAVRVSHDLELDSDAAILKFGADSDISVTHVADTGLLLATSAIDGDVELQFRDAGLKIHSSVDGQLDIDSDGEVEISAVTNLDLDAADVQIDATATFSIQGADDSDVTVNALAKDLNIVVSGGGAQVLKLSSAGTGTDAIDVDAVGGIDVDTQGVLALDGASGIDIGKTADVAIDVDSAAFDLDASGAITIDGTSTISIGGAAAAGKISIGKDETQRTVEIGTQIGNTTVDIDAGTGGFIVDTTGAVSLDAASASNFTTSSGALTLHGAGGINIGTPADVAIDVDASAFALDASSTLSLDGSDNTNLTMSAAADGENKTLTISASNSGTGEGHLSLSSDTQVTVTDGSATLLLDGGATSLSGVSTLDIDTTGLVTVDTADAISLDSGAASNFTTSAGSLTLAGAAGVTVTSTGGTLLLDGSGQTVDLNSAALDIDASGSIDILSTSTFSIDGSGNSNVTTDTGNLTLSTSTSGNLVANSAGAIDIDAADAVEIDATGISLDSDAASNFTTSAGSLTLSGAAGVTVTSTGGTLLLDGAGQTVDLNASLIDVDGASLDIDLTGAVAIDAGAALSFDAVGASNLTTDSGSLTLSTTTSGDLVASAADALDIDALGGKLTLDGSGGVDIGKAANVAVAIGHESSTTTIGGALTVAGNLVVQGSTTQIDTTNLRVEDRIIQLAKGDAADADVDQGFVFTRASANLGGDSDKEHGALFFKGSDAAGKGLFVLGVTNDDGSAAWTDGIADDDLSDLKVGKLMLDGTAHHIDVSGSDLTLTSSANIDLVPSSDLVLTGDFMPSADNSYDLGSLASAWRHLFLDGDITLASAGSVQTDAGLLTVAGSSGVTVTSTGGTLHLNGAGQTVDLDAATLDIDATGAVDILAGAAFSIDGTGNSNVTASAGNLTLSTSTSGNLVANSAAAIDIDAVDAVEIDATGISLDSDAASNFSTSVGGLTLAGAAGVTVTSTGGTLALNGAGQTVDLDAATLDVDTTGAVEIDATGISLDSDAASNFSTSIGALTLAGAAGVTVTSTGGTLHLNGTGQTVDIDSAALDIDASGAVSVDASGAISLDAGAASNLTTSVGALTLDGAAGVNIAGNAAEIDITTTGALDINSGSATLDATSLAMVSTGSASLDAVDISIDSTDTTNLTMTADVAAVRTLTISASNDNVGGEGRLSLSSDAQVDIADGTATVTLDGGALSETGMTSMSLSPSGNITLQSTGGAVDVDADGGILSLDGSTGINIGTEADVPVDIDASTLDINASSSIVIDSASSATLGAASFNIDADGGAGSGEIAIDTTDTTNGVKIATALAGVPVSIGNGTSETTVNDNLTVSGTSTFNSNVLIDTNSGATFRLRDVSAGSNKFVVDSSGNTQIFGTLTVDGVLTSSGSQLSIEDPLIKIGSDGNAEGDFKDVGFYCSYGSTTNDNLGLIYDNSASRFKLYESLNDPAAEEFDFTAGSATASSLELGQLFVNDAAEDGGSGIATPLTTHATYYATAAAETSTLAAGTEGQVKVLAMKTDNGDMVVTVANGAWTAVGHTVAKITLSAKGQACTLQYIDSQWYCIGNNGCTFSSEA